VDLNKLFVIIFRLFNDELSKLIFAYSVAIDVFSTLNIDGPGFSETSAKDLS
jgi:hypothetical protein